MISSTMYKSIIEKINENRFFHFNDFVVDSSTEYFRLRYRLNNKYYFKISNENTNKQLSLAGVMNNTPNSEYLLVTYRPAEITDIKKVEVESSYDIQNALNEWLTCMSSEIRNDPVIRNIEKEIQKFQDMADKIEIDEDADFTQSEIDEFEDKLNTLEQRLQDEIDNLKKDNKILKINLNKICSEIEMLKSTLPVSKKKNWLRTLAIKIGFWLSKPENQAVLIDNIKDIKELIE